MPEYDITVKETGEWLGVSRGQDAIDALANFKEMQPNESREVVATERDSGPQAA